MPGRVTVISGQDSAALRGLEASLSEAGVRVSHVGAVELEQLLALDAAALVVLVEGFVLANLLGTLRELHDHRPALALVFIAGSSERFAVWQAFEGSWLPPLVLRGAAPSRVVLDAIRVAYKSALTEHMDRPFTSSPPTQLLTQAATALLHALEKQDPDRDHYFDRLLPVQLRSAANRFWTPLEVVQRCVAWFQELGIRSVVDVGSGVGKFCVVGALTSTCSFIGIEQRPRLATVARNLALLFKVDHRVSVIDGLFGEVPLPTVDCYYFFNPFEENLFPVEEALDDQVELSADRFRRDLRAFRALVAASPLGTYFLSYNGIGGRLPDCLDEVRGDGSRSAPLRLFQKVGRSTSKTRAPDAGPLT